MSSSISDITIKPIKVRSLPPESHRSSPLRLSRQGSIGGAATEVYFRDSPVAVPFRWESRPGTPKVNSGDRRPLPPLTPPPSYLSTPARSRRAKAVREIHSSGGGILNLIKKSHHQRRSSPPSLSSSSSSSSSSPSTPDSYGTPARRKLLADHFYDEEEHVKEEVEVGSLCFGTRRGCSASFIKLLLRQHA